MTDMNEWLTRLANEHLLDRARDHQLTRLPSGTPLHMTGCTGCSALDILRSRINELEAFDEDKAALVDGQQRLEARIKELEEGLEDAIEVARRALEGEER